MGPGSPGGVDSPHDSPPILGVGFAWRKIHPLRGNLRSPVEDSLRRNSPRKLPRLQACLSRSDVQKGPDMGISPKDMPNGTDGQAHLFFTGVEPAQFIAVSTTGCIAVQSPDNPVRIFRWHFRMKGQELITFPPTPWLILWSCRAPGTPSHADTSPVCTSTIANSPPLTPASLPASRTPASAPKFAGTVGLFGHGQPQIARLFRQRPHPRQRGWLFPTGASPRRRQPPPSRNRQRTPRPCSRPAQSDSPPAAHGHKFV